MSDEKYKYPNRVDTGRIIDTNPRPQNIPIRTEEMKESCRGITVEMVTLAHPTDPEFRKFADQLWEEGIKASGIPKKYFESTPQKKVTDFMEQLHNAGAFRNEVMGEPMPVDNPCPICGCPLELVHPSRPNDFRCPANECRWDSRRSRELRSKAKSVDFTMFERMRVVGQVHDSIEVEITPCIDAEYEEIEDE